MGVSVLSCTCGGEPREHTLHTAYLPRTSRYLTSGCVRRGLTLKTRIYLVVLINNIQSDQTLSVVRVSVCRSLISLSLSGFGLRHGG